MRGCTSSLVSLSWTYPNLTMKFLEREHLFRRASNRDVYICAKYAYSVAKIYFLLSPNNNLEKERDNFSRSTKWNRLCLSIVTSEFYSSNCLRVLPALFFRLSINEKYTRFVILLCSILETKIHIREVFFCQENLFVNSKLYTNMRHKQ